MKEKLVQELVWLVWSSWIRKQKRKGKRKTLEEEEAQFDETREYQKNRGSRR